jgi:hypothetical protein
VTASIGVVTRSLRSGSSSRIVARCFPFFFLVGCSHPARVTNAPKETVAPAPAEPTEAAGCDAVTDVLRGIEVHPASGLPVTEEYRVLADVLSHYRCVVIGDEFFVDRRKMKGVFPESFVEQSMVPTRLEARFPSEFPAVLVDGKLLISDEHRLVDLVSRGLPGLISVSRVSFNSTRTTALVVVDWICGGECGGGQIFTVERKGKHWVCTGTTGPQWFY